MMNSKRSIPIFLFAAAALAAPPARPQTTDVDPDSSLARQIRAIVNRPEYKNANFGVEVYSLDEDTALYALNGEKFFTPGSTTKLLTEGVGLELLGAEYRFHTRVYRTGSVDSSGTLKGDLILVAGGDPNLSGRIRPGGKLAFENDDHSYSESRAEAKAVPGDPLLVIRELAAQIAAHGVKKIDGGVIVNASLFPEGGREGGTGVVVSPISLNDNLIDLTISRGGAEGEPAALSASPETSYITFDNHITTGPPGSKLEIEPPAESINPDGSYSVKLAGKYPLDSPPILRTYAIPQPSRFAQVTLVEALRADGIEVKLPPLTDAPEFKKLSPAYVAANLVAEHISPPLSEEIRVTLKVSQNLHAAMMPFILGAVLGHNSADVEQSGYDAEREFLTKGGVDLSGASQADGAGLASSAFFTPDFMVHYLAFMSKRKDFSTFLGALPILGRDGTLWDVGENSPAAGHVLAKPGTYESFDALNKRPMLNGKGLAGYITTAGGRHVAFAAYANHVPFSTDDPAVPPKIVGEALAQIAAAIYSAPPDRPLAH